MLCTVSLTSPPAVERVIQKLKAWGNGSYPMDLSSLVIVISMNIEVPVQSSSIIHCKNESVYCTLNCPNTHTKNKNSVCIGTKWCAVNTFIFTV